MEPSYTISWRTNHSTNAGSHAWLPSAVQWQVLISRHLIVAYVSSDMNLSFTYLDLIEGVHPKWTKFLGYPDGLRFIPSAPGDYLGHSSMLSNLDKWDTNYSMKSCLHAWKPSIEKWQVLTCRHLTVAYLFGHEALSHLTRFKWSPGAPKLEWSLYYMDNSKKIPSALGDYIGYARMPNIVEWQVLISRHLIVACISG